MEAKYPQQTLPSKTNIKTKKKTNYKTDPIRKYHPESSTSTSYLTIALFYYEWRTTSKMFIWETIYSETYFDEMQEISPKLEFCRIKNIRGRFETIHKKKHNQLPEKTALNQRYNSIDQNLTHQ